MKIQAFVPFVTYPEANADVFGQHAAFVAAQIGASIHAIAINAAILDTSNALSKLLVDTPRLIRQAQASSRGRGEHMFAVLEEKAGMAEVHVTTDTLSSPIAMLGETAALNARYYDLSLMG